MAESKNKGRNKGHDNLIPIKKGERLNPNGRPIGQRNYSTIYKEALLKLAKANGKEAEELEEEILQKGLAMARKGDYKFYKDILDRVHGMPKQSVDLTSGGKELPVPIMQITNIGTGKQNLSTNNGNPEDSEPKS